VGVFQILSGVYLNIGVYRIHSYFKDKQAEVRVNTKIMILHASAFGFYLLSDVILYSAYTVFIFYPNNITANNVYTIASIIWVCASFISQVCLCAIFWDLGSKPRQNEPRMPSIRVEDFDEEAEVQSRIWNNFIRSRNQQPGRYVVDAQLILSLKVDVLDAAMNSNRQSGASI
jgi:hypothetical protein